jgi:hypothetical protein
MGLGCLADDQTALGASKLTWAASHQNWRDDLQVNATGPDNGPNGKPQQTNSGANPDLNVLSRRSDDQFFPGHGTPQHGGAPHCNPGRIYGAASYGGLRPMTAINIVESMTGHLPARPHHIHPHGTLN